MRPRAYRPAPRRGVGRRNSLSTRQPAGSPERELVGASKKGLRGDEGREADFVFERHCRRPAQDYGHTHGVSGVSPSRSFTGWAWRASGSSGLTLSRQYPTCSPPSNRNVSSSTPSAGRDGGSIRAADRAGISSSRHAILLHDKRRLGHIERRRFDAAILGQQDRNPTPARHVGADDHHEHHDRHAQEHADDAPDRSPEGEQ